MYPNGDMPRDTLIVAQVPKYPECLREAELEVRALLELIIERRRFRERVVRLPRSFAHRTFLVVDNLRLLQNGLLGPVISVRRYRGHRVLRWMGSGRDNKGNKHTFGFIVIR